MAGVLVPVLDRTDGSRMPRLESAMKKKLQQSCSGTSLARSKLPPIKTTAVLCSPVQGPRVVRLLMREELL